VAGLGLLSSYDSVDIILVSIMPCVQLLYIVFSHEHPYTMYILLPKKKVAVKLIISLCKQFIDLQLVKSFQICNLIFSLKLTL
jgi:hypothetical protein